MHHATPLRFPQLFSLAHKCKNGNGVASYKSWGRFSTQRKRHTIRAFSCKCMGASLLAQGQTIMQCARPHPRNFMRARPVVLSRRRRAAFMSRRDFPVRINIFATTHTHMRRLYIAARAHRDMLGGAAAAAGAKSNTLSDPKLSSYFSPASLASNSSARGSYLFYPIYMCMASEQQKVRATYTFATIMFNPSSESPI